MAILNRTKRHVKVSPVPTTSNANNKANNSNNTEKQEIVAETELSGTPLTEDNAPVAPFEKAGTCGKGCNICFPQYFPASRSISDKEAKDMTTELQRGIADNYEYLNSVLTYHADKIIQRWKKLSQSKRAGLLLEIADLYPNHPAQAHQFNANMKPAKDWFIRRMARDISASLPAFSQDRVEFTTKYMLEMMRPMVVAHARTVFLESWLLPYLDVETLSQSPLVLLSLLNSRTKHAPHLWASYDKINIVGAEHIQVLGGHYNPNCISFHPDNYGELCKWDGQLCHRGIVIGYTQGIYVLTAQGRMMSFLRAFVDRILGDIQQRHRCGAEGPEGENTVSNSVEQAPQPQPQPQPRWEQLVQSRFSPPGQNVSSSWSLHANQHLIAPTRADPMEIYSKIRALHQSALDKLWELQTDPGCVQLAVKELCSCYYFYFLDREQEWDRIVDEVIFLPIRREKWWRQTLKECESLLESYKMLEKEGSQDNRLRYDMSILILEDCCTEQLNMAIQDVQYSLPYQPGFEDCYDWEQSRDGKRRAPTIHAKDWFSEDPLFWSLDCFCNDRFRDFSSDPVVYLRVFDDQLRKSSEKERKRVSPAMMMQVGDLAAIDEIRTAIKCTQGINRNAVLEFCSTPRHKEEWDRRQVIAKTFIRVKNDVWCSHDLAIASAPAVKSLCTKYPWPKGKAVPGTPKRAADARDALAEIWRRIRNEFKKAIVRASAAGPYTRECLDNLSFDLSDRYQALKRQEVIEIEAALQLQTRPSGHDKLLLPAEGVDSDPQQHWLNVEESYNLKKYVLQDISSNTPKTKTHCTRTQRASATSTKKVEHLECSERGEPTDSTAKERITIKAANLPLLLQMLPEANSQFSGLTGPKHWKWQHFLDVMIDSGCVISQGSGSAVSLEHPSGMGRIVFHQPHPQAVIDPIMLRSMGKRLAKWFGWSRDTFVARK